LNCRTIRKRGIRKRRNLVNSKAVEHRPAGPLKPGRKIHPPAIQLLNPRKKGGINRRGGIVRKNHDGMDRLPEEKTSLRLRRIQTPLVVRKMETKPVVERTETEIEIETETETRALVRKAGISLLKIIQRHDL
jgi:hypothetical protein